MMLSWLRMWGAILKLPSINQRGDLARWRNPVSVAKIKCDFQRLGLPPALACPSVRPSIGPSVFPSFSLLSSFLLFFLPAFISLVHAFPN